MSFARALYSWLTWAAQPLLRRKLRRRAVQEPGYAQAVPERFGYYAPASLGEAGRGRWLWVHAVSLGETRAAAILLKALREREPDLQLLLTHGTATGRAEGQKLLHPGDVQVWLPWDTVAATRRFLQQFRPAIGVLMETEIWPNLMAECQRQGVPVVLANARLNDKSLAGAQRGSALALPAYRSLSAIWAQAPEDAERFAQLGARVDGVLGNLKFDVIPDEEQIALGRRWHSMAPVPVVVFASSREGEEAQWLQALQQSGSLDAVARVQWLIVPRHPQRFAEVQSLLEGAGLSVSVRSEWGLNGPAAADVWLGDSMGEMQLYYAMSDLGLLGGSFEPLGGQNLIEAAACGCPMLLGPHTFNFAQAAEQAVNAGAALRVKNMLEAVVLVQQLQEDPDRRESMRRSASGFATSHQGAAASTADAVLALVNRSI